ncbi:hypothetical protein GCK72_010056 [Caenorhabditis remanei]|uniref:Serpentine receptor class gamma n=1 Tax=Caenorhabditis remanei TaxID=31234 RepID=A0A6A5H466_CAERE|nr:hypothetical protein GCK72_010056 [Caenorhabditis remanei]KAF1761799.1 hypothetical protein GCK72_010056 [Caenorhabditis remanei]
MSSTRFTLPANFSYDDPLPFQCNENLNLGVSLAMYGLQVSYLILGAALNFLIILTIFKSKSGSYRHNSFYILYAADAIMGIYINIAEVLFGRLFIYITPLCPIVSPYFFTPSVITKFYYAAVHYSLGFKTFSQIFMSFNRMTCVIFPLKHLKLWNRILYPVLVTLVILPLGVIWNILISRVYINPNGAGFSVNYKDTVQWATISLLHLIHCSICLVLVIFCFIVTIIGLATLQQRIKSAERSLTVVTLIMSVQTMIFAFIQIYFAFFASYYRNKKVPTFFTDAQESRSVSTTSHHRPLSRAVSTVVAPVTG